MGTWSVNACVLVANGSLARSRLTTVNSGAVLFGSGTVGSTLVNAGGFLVPGNSPGTMTVAGDLTIQRNAFYVVQVNPQTASRVNVIGTASLDGTVAAVFAPGSYLRSSYTILTADNRRTGRFEDLETFGLPRNFRARLDYFNNSVDLNLRAQLIGDGLSVFQPIVLPPIRGCRFRRRTRPPRHCRPSPAISSASAGRSTTSSTTAARCRPHSCRSMGCPAAISSLPWTSFPARPRPARKRSPSSSPTSS